MTLPHTPAPMPAHSRAAIEERIAHWTERERLRQAAHTYKYESEKPMSTATSIERECDAIKELLLAKNLAYGDSALNPIRVFSRVNSIEQLRVRLDDKLSRLMRGASAGEDVVIDLIGYLVLLRIATKESGVGQ